MEYRKMASILSRTHNRHGSAMVSTLTSEDVLEQVLTHQLRVREDAQLEELIGSPEISPKQARRAFWTLRREPEWGDPKGVVWTSLEGNATYVGLGILVDPATPLPVVKKMVTSDE